MLFNQLSQLVNSFQEIARTLPNPLASLLRTRSTYVFRVTWSERAVRLGYITEMH